MKEGDLRAILICLKKRNLEDLHKEIFGSRNKPSESSVKQAVIDRIVDRVNRNC